MTASSAELADRAPWAADRGALARSTAERAFDRFSDAFGRWRQLYAGARAQLEEANRKSEIHGLPADERREAKTRQAQAQEQIMLLERGISSGNTDFFSYRYLATEGFLPGYNFPRLPLYAFIPSGGYQGGNAAYLQRARFLAIAEFGPRSLIYHEGRAYRVNKARLPSNLRTPEGRLATERLFVCDNCGAAHKRETERCMACGDSIAGVQPILNVLRIDNVETEARRKDHGQRRREAAAGLRHSNRLRLVGSRWRARRREGHSHGCGWSVLEPRLCAGRFDQPRQQRSETAQREIDPRFRDRSGLGSLDERTG